MATKEFAEFRWRSHEQASCRRPESLCGLIGDKKVREIRKKALFSEENVFWIESGNGAEMSAAEKPSNLVTNVHNISFIRLLIIATLSQLVLQVCTAWLTTQQKQQH